MKKLMYSKITLVTSVINNESGFVLADKQETTVPVESIYLNGLKNRVENLLDNENFMKDFSVDFYLKSNDYQISELLDNLKNEGYEKSTIELLEEVNDIVYEIENFNNEEQQLFYALVDEGWGKSIEDCMLEVMHPTHEEHLGSWEEWMRQELIEFEGVPEKMLDFINLEDYWNTQKELRYIIEVDSNWYIEMI